jgi:hypothetical protein
MVPGREIYARHYIGDTEVETTEADVAECHPHYKDLSLDERMEAIKADWIAEFGEPELEEEEIKLEAEPDTLDPFSLGETLTLAQLKVEEGTVRCEWHRRVVLVLAMGRLS